MTSLRNIQHLITSNEIHLLMVFVVLAVPLLASPTRDPQLKKQLYDHLPRNDVLFTEDVLLEVPAWSRIECSKKCEDRERCVMCTFHSSSEGSQGQCRLHSRLQIVGDAKQNMPGARSMGRCNGHYVLACDRCVRGVKKWVNHTTARQACGNLQGQMVMAKSAEEVDCIRSSAKYFGLGCTWLGVDDKQEPDVFRWDDGSLLPDNSSLWREGEPEKKRPGHDCVYFYHPNNPSFQDVSCYVRCNFMCQKDVVRVMT